MKYFRLRDDINYPGRWYLGDIFRFDNWELVYSIPSGLRDLEIDVYRNGCEMDFTLSELYGLPIVSETVMKLLDEFTDVQFVPVEIRSVAVTNHYYLALIDKFVDCVDETKSLFEKFDKNDPVRPDKAGEYRAFLKLVIDPSRVSNANVFRIKKFDAAIIVSGEVKDMLQESGATGLSFREVTDFKQD